MKTKIMKHYDSLELWKKAQSKSNQTLIQQLRKLVKDTGLPLVETVKWGNGCWVKGDLPVIYSYAFADGIQLGFFAGSQIADPKNLLEGKGKFVRFIKIRSRDDIDTKYFTALIKKAVKINYK